MPIELPAPPPVRDAVDELLAALAPLHPAPLRAVVLYGSLAKGKAMTGSSDVNLLLVMADASAAALARLAEPLARARRRAGAAPLVAAEAELPRALTAFPLKFADILRSHRVLLGDDPLAGLSVPPEALREDALRSLAALSLRLKRLGVERAERPELLLEGLVDLLPRALVAFAALQPSGAPERREDLVAAAAGRLGVDPAPLLELLAVKKGGGRTLGPAALLDALLGAVDRAARA